MPSRTPESVVRLASWVLDRNSARSSWRRRRWLARAAGMTPVVMADMQGARVLVRTEDQFVSTAVFADGRYADAVELEAAVRTLRTSGYGERLETGGTFLDIGANIGTATVSALTRHGFREAIAIEPEPGNLALLRANVVLNDLDDRVRVIPAAVGERDGVAELLVNADNPGDHRVATGTTESGKTVSVVLRSVDSMVATGEIDPSEVGLLWIDVQGFEPAVLRGASTLIDAGVPAVIEYSPGHMGSELRSIQELIRVRFLHIGDLREARGGGLVRLRPASDIADVRPAGLFTDLLLVPPSAT